MKISKLLIHNLRNHTASEIIFAGRLNIIHGLNGAGKTTVLEAVSICSISKSFMPAPENSMIKNGEAFYSVFSESVTDLDTPYKVGIKYASGARKQINSSIGDNLSPKDIIGEIPLVILSPDYKAVTFGAPQDKRQFIDSILSQAGKLYMDHAITLKRCLKQRNNLLSSAKKDYAFDYSLIEPWTDMMIKSGSEMIHRRIRFIKEFTPFFNDSYFETTGGKESVSIEYIPYGMPPNICSSNASKDDILLLLKQFSDRIKKEEIRRGTTMFGPQKDDLRICINSRSAKETASQGQHKSLLISLKFAEFNYLKEIRRETPVILLDDIFSELDDERTERVITMLEKNSAQSFITMTNADKLKKIAAEFTQSAFFSAENGVIVRE